MAIAAQLNEDMKTAMKAGEKEKLTAIRLIRAAIQTLETEDRSRTVTDGDVMTIIAREIKSTKELVIEYKKGAGYEAKIQELENRVAAWQSYLPQQLAQEELEEIVKAVIAQVGAASKADIGKVMAELMPKVKGRAEGKIVNQTVGKLLG